MRMLLPLVSGATNGKAPFGEVGVGQTTPAAASPINLLRLQQLQCAQ